MLRLNYSWTKHSCCIPQWDCKFITCIESLNSVEQEWFWVSALKNSVMPNTYHMAPTLPRGPGWWSTNDLERKVWGCSYGMCYSNCSALKNQYCWAAYLLTFCCCLLGTVTSGNRRGMMVLQYFHLTCHSWYLHREEPASVRSFIFHIPALQPALAPQPLTWSCPSPELAIKKKKKKRKRDKESKAELKCCSLLELILLFTKCLWKTEIDKTSVLMKSHGFSVWV